MSIESKRSSWEIWLDDPLGNRLALLDTALAFNIARVANSQGSFGVSLPGNFDDTHLVS